MFEQNNGVFVKFDCRPITSKKLYGIVRFSPVSSSCVIDTTFVGVNGRSNAIVINLDYLNSPNKVASYIENLENIDRIEFILATSDYWLPKISE